MNCVRSLWTSGLFAGHWRWGQAPTARDKRAKAELGALASRLSALCSWVGGRGGSGEGEDRKEGSDIVLANNTCRWQAFFPRRYLGRSYHSGSLLLPPTIVTACSVCVWRPDEGRNH